MADKVARRSKQKFKTARAAWGDIGRKRGITATSVKSKAHTSSHWVFKLKPIPAQAKRVIGQAQPLKKARTQMGGGGLKRRRGL